MKLHALTTLLFLSAVTLSTGTRAQPQDQRSHQHRSHRDMLVARAAKGELEFAAKRQAGPVVVAAAPAPSGSSVSNQAPPSQAAPMPPGAPLTASSAAPSAGASTTSSLSGGSASGSGTGMTGTMTGTGSSLPTPVVSVPPGTNGVPALSLISSGMTPGTPSPVASTYAPGATPPVSGAPVLPAQCKFPPSRVVSYMFVGFPLMAFGF
jgi:hypothetical protein